MAACTAAPAALVPPFAKITRGIAATSRSPAPCSRPARQRLAAAAPRAPRPAAALRATAAPVPGGLAPNPPAARPVRPPDDYDHARILHAGSVAFCRAHFPEIADLAEAGVVVVVKRPPDYVERREDGYQEPEVVVLVGTSHVSLSSQEHVERVVRAVRPNNTVVELCRSRASLMYIEEEQGGAAGGGGGARGNDFALGGGQGFVQSLQRSLRLGGAPALLIRAALAAVSRRLGASAGAVPGGEFRAARRAALSCGSQLVLGDRPLEITLSRAWAAASGTDRAQFSAFLLRGLFGDIPKISQQEVDRMRSDDGVVRQLFLALSERYPALVRRSPSRAAVHALRLSFPSPAMLHPSLRIPAPPLAGGAPPLRARRVPRLVAQALQGRQRREAGRGRAGQGPPPRRLLCPDARAGRPAVRDAGREGARRAVLGGGRRDNPAGRRWVASGGRGSEASGFGACPVPRGVGGVLCGDWESDRLWRRSAGAPRAVVVTRIRKQEACPSTTMQASSMNNRKQQSRRSPHPSSSSSVGRQWFCDPHIVFCCPLLAGGSAE